MNLPVPVSNTSTTPVRLVTEGEILILCSLQYTGTVMYHGLLPGVGCHGGPLVAIQLLEIAGQPMASVDAGRLVERYCCMNGWGTA